MTGLPQDGKRKQVNCVTNQRRVVKQNGARVFEYPEKAYKKGILFID